MSSKGPKSGGPIGIVVVFTVITLGLAWAFKCLLTVFIDAEKHEQMQSVLTNVATIGGIISGLSLAGFTFLLASTPGVRALIKKHGRLAHWMFLTVYSLTVLSCLACAFTSGMENFQLMVIVASVSAALMITGTVLTVLLINSIAGWEDREEILAN
ncbi:hypothetical protein [Enteractinococcus coprophilus]|uniref:Uncharacterized protein n=1 Tax=Enteractinococcus coprophilus TaxID=1027633 RepID=A0A543ANU4_9MICC|nr:hypothetical protein [Enteractinococcus coprophilus]TQL74239.1 hypothetical protein FB556_0696 [Enteractinococcus coprophilus]